MRTVLLITALFSLPALATGERVLLTPVNSPLAETICVSMSCVTEGARDVTVAAKEVKGAMQFTVTSASGQVKLVTTAGLTENGTVSSTDLMRATSLIVKSIEGPAAVADAAAAKPAAGPSKPATKSAKAAKRPSGKLLAKR